jgi:hypothetical protein
VSGHFGEPAKLAVSNGCAQKRDAERSKERLGVRE